MSLSRATSDRPSKSYRTHQSSSSSLASDDAESFASKYSTYTGDEDKTHGWASIQLDPVVFDHHRYSPLPTPRNTSQNGPSREVEGESSVVRLGNMRRLRFLAVLPALVFAIIMAGIATGLLIYLFTRRVAAQHASDIFHGVFAVREPSVSISSMLGTAQTSNGISSGSGTTTLYGLAISSISAHIVSWSVPFVVSVFGFVLANMWIREQNAEAYDALPTPTQYGLLLGLFNGAGLKNVYDIFSYLLCKRRSRPTAPRILHIAVSVVSFTLLTVIALSLADIWLHTTTDTMSYTYDVDTASPPPMGSQVDLEVCPGPLGPLNNGLYRNCLVNLTSTGLDSDTIKSGPVWGNDYLRKEGMAVLENTSNKSRTYTISDENVGDLTVLIPSTFPTNIYSSYFSTVAMRASCEAVQNCKINPHSPPFLTCPSFTPPARLDKPSTPDTKTVQRWPNAAASAVINQYNSTNSTLLWPEAGSTSIAGAYSLNSSLNPSSVQLLLSWSDALNSSLKYWNTAGWPGWYNMTTHDGINATTLVYYVGTCEMSVYNVNVSYTYSSPGSIRYSLASSPAEVNFNTSSALLAALDPAYSPTLASYMLSTFQPTVYDVPSDYAKDSRQRDIANRISSGALGMVSGILQRTPVLRAQTQITVTRYPLAPLCAVLVSLYIYSLICFAVFVLAAFLTSPAVVFDSGTRTRHTLLELLQFRLTNPRAVVADAFDTRTAGQVLASGSMDALFAEDRSARLARLGVGFVHERADATSAEQSGVLTARRTVQRLRVSEVAKLARS